MVERQFENHLRYFFSWNQINDQEFLPSKSCYICSQVTTERCRLNRKARLGGACNKTLVLFFAASWAQNSWVPQRVLVAAMKSTRVRPRPGAAPQRPLDYKSQARIPILCSSRTEMLHLQVRENWKRLMLSKNGGGCGGFY